MKRTVAILAAFTLMLSLTSCATQSDVDNAYEKGYRDAVKELDEEYYDRLEKEKEKSYQKGYNIGIREGKQKAEAQSDVKYIEVPKFYSADQEEMYDEIWDEVYERAYEDACEEYSRKIYEIEREYDLDLDYLFW